MTNPAQPPKPWDHQVRALDFIRDKPGAMLAMDMGVGKTKIAIDLMEEIEARRTLIMAPLSVVDHVWPREIRTHSRRPATVIPLGDKLPNVRAKLKKAADGLALATARKGPAVIIVNYESAYREPLGDWLKDLRWDLLIMDESHRLKSPSGKISRFASQLSDRSRRRLALSGTPMPHSPLDIYAQYRAVDKRVFGVHHQQFKNRYAEFEIVAQKAAEIPGDEPDMIQAVSGYRNLEELNEKFYSLAFRVTAAEVLDLPGAIGDLHPRQPGEESPEAVRRDGRQVPRRTGQRGDRDRRQRAGPAAALPTADVWVPPSPRTVRPSRWTTPRPGPYRTSCKTCPGTNRWWYSPGSGTTWTPSPRRRRR